MSWFPSHEVVFSIGNFELRWYALLIVAGCFLIYYLSDREMVRVGYREGLMDDLFIGCMIGGIIGARLWYVLFSDLSSYLKNPLSIFMIWKGGLAIHGAVLGAVTFTVLYCRRHHLGAIHLIDIILPNALLAQAIGRWGNFANYECYGPEVKESYFDGILSFIKSGMYIDGAYRMPTFFFESVLCVIGWILIKLYCKHSKYKRGDRIFCYISWYGAVRFWIESYRTDNLMIGPFKMAQVISVIGLIVGIAGLLGAFKKYIMRKKPLVIFDLDGTLLDTEPVIVYSFQKVLENHQPGRIMTDREKADLLGPTLKESMARYFPDGDFDALIAEYRRYNVQAHHDGLVKPIEHVPELLEYLHENGYEMNVASSKIKSTVILGLEANGLMKYFDADRIIGEGEVTHYKPDKETVVLGYQKMKRSLDNCIYVGDSTGDIECARNAGVYSIAVVTNELKRDELAASRPNSLISDMLEIEEILKGDHPWTDNLM